MARRILAVTVKVLLPVLVLAVGVGGFVYLVQTRPSLSPNEVRERIWPVEVQAIALGEVQPELRLYGEIVAGREVELRALVAGEVEQVAENFRDGGVVETGQVLVTIDSFDYQADYDEAQAQLNEARAKQDEIAARRAAEEAALVRDREMLDLRERDVERVSRLHRSGNVSDRTLDDAKLELSRQRQVLDMRGHALSAEDARLRQQEATVRRLEVALRRAERDLANTRFVAPFRGFLADTQAEVGKRLGVNDRLARLIDSRRMEARAHISDAEYGRILADGDASIIGRPARVLWRSGADSFSFDAAVVRVGAEVDPTTGGIAIYVRLNPIGRDFPIRPGAFVEIRLPDRRYAKVARLPESAVFDQETVFVVRDDRLEARRVRIVGYAGDDALIEGELGTGDRVVTTRFTEIGPGVKVEVR